MLKFILMIVLLSSGLALAAQHQMIDTLGASPKGQFVALEEYGYRPHSHTYYVSIRIMNVWTKEYVGKSVDVEMPADRPTHLTKARQQAKSLAQGQLMQFKISG